MPEIPSPRSSTRSETSRGNSICECYCTSCWYPRKECICQVYPNGVHGPFGVHSSICPEYVP